MPLDTANPPEDLPEGLIYCSDEGPGIRRRKSGQGFAYFGPGGEPVTAAATLDRIEKLAIPPAWTDVWIAPRPGCHIQATGRDAKGRKQYRYHDNWRLHRDEGKYGRVAAFGRALPSLRKRIEADLRRRGLPREKVLAAVVSLLEQTLIRVGNDEYARANNSFGLTTLRDRHAKLNGVGGRFEFVGKSGKKHCTAFSDRRLARIVKACQELRGQRLFQYQDESGAICPVTSGDVNDYLRRATGQDFTAKDFRTWAGTVEAARILCDQQDTTATKATITACVKAVSQRLGNTPAVCRKAYIHPAITEAFEQRRLAVKPGRSDRAFETAVIRLLEMAAGEKLGGK
ncbi:MAG TPA: DNA topoisomerase IB [Caulobacter sp.]|nr:DNA topoisomerase IB [Caulobacter sp.]